MNCPKYRGVFKIETVWDCYRYLKRKGLIKCSFDEFLRKNYRKVPDGYSNTKEGVRYYE